MNVQPPFRSAELTNLRHWLPVVLFGLIVLVGLSTTAKAEPIYQVSAVACGSNPNGSSGSPIAVSTGNLQFCGGSVSAAGSANAGLGGVGASAEGLYVCCGGGGGGQGFARVQTTVLFTGPAPSVTLSLNLSLHGDLGGGLTSGTSIREADLEVLIGANRFFAALFSRIVNGQDLSGASGNMIFNSTGPTICPSACLSTTPAFTVPTGVPIFFSMSMLASVDNSGNNISGFVNASNTLYFPQNSPVFNLPDGFSASIEGLNVANNRVIGAEVSPVPEASTYTMLGAGLVLLGIAKRYWRIAAPADKTGEIRKNCCSPAKN